MAYFLNFLYSAAGDKYFNCSIPASTANAGRPLQIEWEIEFEAKKNVDQFIVASLSSAGAVNLLFLRSGTDFEFRSETNANWIVTTGVTLTNFNVFKIRSTFDGTTRVQTLHINGNLIATRNPTTGSVGFFATIAGLNSSATRGGALKYLKYTDFVTPANNRLYDANLSNGTGNILPESLFGLNATQVGAWPANDSEWVFYEAPTGGTAQNITVSPLQQLTETLTSSVLVNQSVTVSDIQQLVESQLVSVSTNQLVSVSAIQQLIETVQSVVSQVTPQEITTFLIQQLVESQLVSVSTNQLVSVSAIQQLIEAAPFSVSQNQLVLVPTVQQLTQLTPVVIDQNTDSGTVQPIVVIPVEQTTQATPVSVSVSVSVSAPAIQQMTQSVRAAIYSTQNINVSAVQQFTHAVLVTEQVPEPINTFYIKLTVLPSPFDLVLLPSPFTLSR